jgi:hypothetical protein
MRAKTPYGPVSGKLDLLLKVRPVVSTGRDLHIGPIREKFLLAALLSQIIQNGG